MVPQRAQLITTDALPVSVLRAIGDLVSARILFALVSGEQRFGELHTTVKGSTKTVVARLKSLERSGLVTRTLYAQVPPKAVYALTDKGRELAAIIEGLSDWERSWRS